MAGGMGDVLRPFAAVTFSRALFHGLQKVKHLIIFLRL